MKTPHPIFKKAFKTLSLATIVFLLFFNVQCKKEHGLVVPVVPVNITLYNKPLSVIQSNIQGKWKLLYVKGGFIANYIRDFRNDNVSWQFTSGVRVLENYNGNIYADTTITWIRDIGVNTGRDSTYLMKFYDKRGYPYIYVVDGIFNDSLVIHDHAIDGQHYHFSKQINP